MRFASCLFKIAAFRSRDSYCVYSPLHDFRSTFPLLTRFKSLYNALQLSLQGDFAPKLQSLRGSSNSSLRFSRSFKKSHSGSLCGNGRRASQRPECAAPQDLAVARSHSSHSFPNVRARPHKPQDLASAPSAHHAAEEERKEGGRHGQEGREGSRWREGRQEGWQEGRQEVIPTRPITNADAADHAAVHGAALRGFILRNRQKQTDGGRRIARRSSSE